MSLFQTNKPKSAGKIMVGPGPQLQSRVLKTLSKMAEMAGATLGPLGKQVLIERPEMDMKPIVTKDGVTVIKSLGYHDAVSQLILEAARDAAIATANEAGDGTTTATILSNAIARQSAEIIEKHKKISPQAIIREMKSLIPYLEEKIAKYNINIDSDNYDTILHRVATLSANGDTLLADKILEAFNTVGDEGNLTIVEVPYSKKENYDIQKLNGYTVELGYEESCRRFATGFINDKSSNLVKMDNPIFLLYDGAVNHINKIQETIIKISTALDGKVSQDKKQQLVIVAHDYDETVLGHLLANWEHSGSRIQVFPLKTQRTMILNSQTDFLYDLQAYTGCPVYDPVNRPLADMNPEVLISQNRVTYFESGRFRTSIVTEEDQDAVDIRVEELKGQLVNPESEYEKNELNLRIGKLTSGIAKLLIYSPSKGETREKRDRAEDAWMAVRGAIKHGALPGGGYVLVRLSADFLAESQKAQNQVQSLALEIIGKSLLEPVRMLYHNYGWDELTISNHLLEMLRRDGEVWDILNNEWIENKLLLDSTPAVVEAVRNSLSIASLLGTLGGIVSFKRDGDTDSEEQAFKSKFERSLGER